MRRSGVRASPGAKFLKTGPIQGSIRWGLLYTLSPHPELPHPGLARAISYVPYLSLITVLLKHAYAR